MSMSKCEVTHREWLTKHFGESAATQMQNGISANYEGGMHCTLPKGHSGAHNWAPNKKRRWFTHNGGTFQIKDKGNAPLPKQD